jgi:hypothetical protein
VADVLPDIYVVSVLAFQTRETLTTTGMRDSCLVSTLANRDRSASHLHDQLGSAPSARSPLSDGDPPECSQSGNTDTRFGGAVRRANSGEDHLRDVSTHLALPRSAGVRRRSLPRSCVNQRDDLRKIPGDAPEEGRPGRAEL